MLNKRIMSLTLAALTTASLAAPAFAANSTALTASYTPITLDVTVPETGTVTINPYGLPVEIMKSDGKTSAGTITGEQITTAPLAIKNNSSTKLKVSVSASTTTSKTSGVTFREDTLKDLETKAKSDTTVVVPTDKSIHLAVDFKKSATVGKTADVTADKLTEEYLKSGEWDTPDASVDLDADGACESTDTGISLPAYDSTSGYVAGSICLFRLSGDLVEDPEDDAWTTKDTFTTTLAFTFKPDTTKA
jgi:hypothetical protein